MQITFNFEEGTTPDRIAAKLRFHAGLLEGMKPKDASSRKNTEAAKTVSIDDNEGELEENDEDIAPPKKTAKKKPVASFDEDEEEEEEDDENEEDEDEDTVIEKKTAKPKMSKITPKMVGDACKLRAQETGGKEGRQEVLTILKKKFGVTSVSALKPEQYASVIKAMVVN